MITSARKGMEKHLAIIGASYLQLPLIEKAKHLGYTTHVFAWAANDVGETAADFFYPISIVDKEAVLNKCAKIGICGICSIASDLAAITVNYVADALNLNGNSMECVKKSTDKYYMRRAFFENGDPSPLSIKVDESTDLTTLNLSFPVIVKPTDRSGSRGIYKLESENGLEKAVASAISESFSKSALIEEYVCGEEFSVEYVSFHGKHNFLAVTKKFTTGAPHFIETGHAEPANLDRSTVNKIKSVVEHALDTLGITDSASHSEVKITPKGDIKIIEIGGRMGGDCIGSDLVYYSTGIDFLSCVISVACGNPPNLKRVIKPRKVRSVYIFTEDDLKEFERIRRETPEKILRIPYLDKDNIGKTTDSSNRAGCYIITD